MMKMICIVLVAVSAVMLVAAKPQQNPPRPGGPHHGPRCMDTLCNNATTCAECVKALIPKEKGITCFRGKPCDSTLITCLNGLNSAAGACFPASG